MTKRNDPTHRIDEATFARAKRLFARGFNHYDVAAAIGFSHTTALYIGRAATLDDYRNNRQATRKEMDTPKGQPPASLRTTAKPEAETAASVHMDSALLQAVQGVINRQEEAAARERFANKYLLEIRDELRKQSELRERELKQQDADHDLLLALLANLERLLQQLPPRDREGDQS